MNLSNAEKVELRKRILILTSYKDWDQNPEVVKEVQLMGNLFKEKGEKPIVLRKINFPKLTPLNYLYLRKQGYKVKTIREACAVSPSMWGKWLKANKLTRDCYSFKEISDMYFSDEDEDIPFF